MHLTAHAQRTIPADLIAVLALVQLLEAPILHITWHPSLDALGQGATSEVREGHGVKPVLVFEKAHYGSLDQFVLSATGQGLGFETRSKLCSDIVMAVQAMHASSKKVCVP